ncbi:Nucleoside-diphosphate sugar epimerases [Rhodospirillaceae bacterium LM-1]|nr:Nucleoside-diphosphate sugar epimerases [Rhodospirillaceae bacterium LM-1]
MYPRDLDDPLLSRLLGRRQSLFDGDVGSNAPALSAAIRESRVLVVGAAGSIGQAFVKQLLPFAPKALHLADLNENMLVELVRDLRSGNASLPKDFATFSVDFAGPEFGAMVAANGPFDVFLNFSALKHVRAERDPFSLMRMIEVNVLALASYLDHPASQTLKRAFSVSTDKSVRPENLMGATKNLMERVLFAHSPRLTANSARFANVAFSAGSLLEGFEYRLQKSQPIAAPSDVRRYFISHAEAGQLCLLGAFLCQTRDVVFPKLNPQDHLMSFEAIARAFLASHGFDALACASEEEARARFKDRPAKAWPCVFSSSDTTGEKLAEEFLRPGDRPDLARFAEAGVVQETLPDMDLLRAFRQEIGEIKARTSWGKNELAQAIQRAVPDLLHEERGKSLDQKM